MDRIEKLFFELLQLSVGNRKALSHAPSNKEWKALFEMAKKQSLIAVAFRGLSIIRNARIVNAAESSASIDNATYLQWLGLTAKIAQRSKTMNEECVKLTELLRHDGFQCCILKGQSNLVNYPEELRNCRTAGDIDVLFRSIEEPYALDLPIRYCQDRARLLDKKAPHITYHHADLAWEGTTEVEGHYRATFLCSPIRNWRLQNWLEDNMPFGVCDYAVGRKTKTEKTTEDCLSDSLSEDSSKLGSSVNESSTGNFTAKGQPSVKNNKYIAFPIPTNSYNAIYQLLHIYKHLFEEGIGLRQLLDYYFVLRALHIEQGDLSDRTPSMAQWAEGMGIAVKSNEEIMHTISRFGMKKFAGAVMWALAKVFDPRDDEETKTIKNPDGSVSVAVSENLSELDLSATASSTGSNPASIQPSGDKQEIHIAKDDWQKRWPWLICEPNEKEGKFLLNEIMMAGNFGKYDPRINHNSWQTKRSAMTQFIIHNWEKTKHNLRLLTHYPEEVISEPFFRLYHWVWRRFELWRY